MGGDGADRWLSQGFRWRDGARLIRFASAARAETLALLSPEKLPPFAMLTTPRGVAVLPEVAEAAQAVAYVPSGPVPEAAAAVEAQLTAAGLLSAGGDEAGRSTPGPALVALG